LLPLGSLPQAGATHTDDQPEGGHWAQDGAVYRDWVRLSADDPSADPADWYRINLTAEGASVDMLRVTVNLTAGGGLEQFFVWAAIHDPDRSLLTEVQAPGYARKSAATVAHRTGVYFVRVYTYSRYQCDYRLNFSITQVANTSDGDDLIQQARFLEPPQLAIGHVNGVWDPFDHYAVNITRTNTTYELLRVVLQPDMERPGQDLDLFLLEVDAKGALHELSSSTSNGSYEVAYYAAERPNMTVYIRVHAYGGITNYSLGVDVVTVTDDGNNNIDRADLLSFGTPRNDTLNLSDARDFFKLNLTAGDLVAVAVTAHGYNATHRKPNFDLYLLSPAGTILNWSFQYDPVERVTYEVPMGDAPEWYYALVTYHDRSPWDGVDAWGTYDVNVTVDHAPLVLLPMPLTTQEDTPLSIPLGSLLSDPEGPLGATRVLSAQNATVALASGILTVDPPANYSGPASFVLRVVDGSRTVDLPFTVRVVPVPDAPAVRFPLPSLALDEDSLLVLDLTSVFVDGDGDSLEFELAVPPSSHLARSTLDGTGLTVVPDADFSGDSALTITARDPSGRAKTVDLVFRVRPVPDAPRVIWADPNVTALEDQKGIELELGTVFSDPDGDTLIFSATGGAHVSYILLGSTLVVDGAQDFYGQTSITVTARDPGGRDATATVRFAFTPVNDPPRVLSQDPVGRQSVNEGKSIVFTVTAEDPEGSAVTYSWSVDGFPVTEPLPRHEFAANYSSQGSHLVSVAVSDGSLATWANWTLDVVNVNRPPTVQLSRPRPGQSFEQGGNVVFEAVATDPDGEQPLVTWSVDGKVVGSGTAFTTSSLKVGKHRLLAVATDAQNATANATVSFEVKEGGGIPGPSTGAAATGIAAAAAAAIAAAGAPSRASRRKRVH
jgi:hypothetical protein